MPEKGFTVFKDFVRNKCVSDCAMSCTCDACNTYSEMYGSEDDIDLSPEKRLEKQFNFFTKYEEYLESMGVKRKAIARFISQHLSQGSMLNYGSSFFFCCKCTLNGWREL